MVSLILLVALLVFAIIAAFKVYEKAGQPGWAAIVPFYNTYVLLKIVGRPGWWLALMFIPVVNLVILIIVFVDLAKAFGKGGGFATLLILLPLVGMPLLAFGDAVYRGPVADPGYQQWLLAQSGYGYPQAAAQPGYHPQVSAGYPAQPGYAPRGYPPGYPPQGPPQQPGYPAQGYPRQPGYPVQGYPQPQAYPGQQAQPSYPPPGRPRY
jgi:hypothetical protein